jgi:threonine dehydratase
MSTYTDQSLLSREEIEQAFERVGDVLSQTPTVRSRHYSAKQQRNVFLKLENFQPTHSFKVRGATNAILSLPEEERKRGIICASGGNHGLGVAYACAELKLPCHVFLAKEAPKIKIEAIKQLGAQATVYEGVFEEANKLAKATAKQEKKAYIHPFDDARVMAGQGTIVLELLKQMERIDSIIVSIGGGGLISGLVSAVKHFTPKTKVIGVETEGTHCLSLSIEAGKIVELDEVKSVAADSLGAPRTEARQFAIVSKYVDELIVMNDDDTIEALLELLREEKILVEPASSCTLAALNSGKIRSDLGTNVVAIMCGGNVAVERVCEWLHKAEE